MYGNASWVNPPLGRHHRPLKRRVWPRVLAGIAITVAIAAGACAAAWSWWMWQHHWRSIDITVNGSSVSMRVDTTLGALMAGNDDFGAVPGRLLAVTGDVLDQHGGEPVSTAVNGHEIAARDREDTAVPEHATVTVESGKDTTEEHDVRREPVPHGSNIVIAGGAIQRVRQHGRDGVREIWVGKKSGKKADKGVTEPPLDLVVEPLNPRPAGRKVIALTFDDGPGPQSPAILDILRDKGVHATFFNLGSQAAAFPAVEQRALAEGHQIANHSNTHPDLTKLDKAAMRAEITGGFAGIKAASGVDTRILRAPYGAFGTKQWADASDLIDMNVLWDIDTLDWKRPGPNAIHDAVLSNAHNGAIVLMHDGGGDRSQDVKALPRIIDDLRAQGYEFVTIDQLMQMA